MIGHKFTRQPNGAYLREDGDWPTGNARAQIEGEKQKAFGNYSRSEALAFLENAIAKNQVRQSWYAVVPNTELKPTKVQAEESTVAAAKEKKVQKRADKKAAKAAVEIATRKPRTAATETPAPSNPGTLDRDKVAQMYANGVKIVDIAVAFGYARGQGQNKIRAILRAANVYNTPTGGAQTTSDTN